jgi:hypothetical protein
MKFRHADNRRIICHQVADPRLKGGPLHPRSDQLVAGRCLFLFSLGLGVGLQQIKVVDTKCQRQLIHCDHSRVALPFFQAADILLAEAGHFRQLFLCKIFALSDPQHVAAKQPTHIHELRSAHCAPGVYQL